ncbi:MAG: Diaminopimelate epimerase [candidate division TM6 bacterium GW2011_GWE2_41_16]|nr:MAG: Diaminopimelate epimerase [candidate division TM6 bacterium GW2011_GWE2_41_16]
MAGELSTALHTVQWFKYESLGNDLLIVDVSKDTKTWQLIEQAAQTRESLDIVALVADRHRGIGSDGVLFIGPDDQVYFYNTDGSIGDVCMNGARTLGLFFKQQRGLNTFPLHIRMGSKNVVVDFKDDMWWSGIGVQSAEVQALSVVSQNKQFDGCFIHIGNPHFINFEHTDVRARDAALIEYGHDVCTHQDFVQGANISFVCHINQSTYDVYTYERGCGLTLACSSALCAIMKLLYTQNMVAKNIIIDFKLKGGEAHAFIDEHDFVYIGAPVQAVFVGKLLIEF